MQKFKGHNACSAVVDLAFDLTRPAAAFAEVPPRPPARPPNPKTPYPGGPAASSQPLTPSPPPTAQATFESNLATIVSVNSSLVKIRKFTVTVESSVISELSGRYGCVPGRCTVPDDAPSEQPFNELQHPEPPRTVL